MQPRTTWSPKASTWTWVTRSTTVGLRTATWARPSPPPAAVSPPARRSRGDPVRAPTTTMTTTTTATATTATPTRPGRRADRPTPPLAVGVPPVRAGPVAALPIAARRVAATQAVTTRTTPAVRAVTTPGGGAEHPCPWLDGCCASKRSDRASHHRGCIGGPGGRSARVVIRRSALVHVAPGRGTGVAPRCRADAHTAHLRPAPGAGPTAPDRLGARIGGPDSGSGDQHRRQHGPCSCAANRAGGVGPVVGVSRGVRAGLQRLLRRGAEEPGPLSATARHHQAAIGSPAAWP